MKEQPTNPLQVFEQIADRAGDGVAIADLNGMFTYANKAMHNIYGYDFEAQELLGMYIPALWPSDLREYLQTTVLPKIMTEGDWQEEVRGLRKDGSECLLGCRVFPIRDEADEIIGMAAHIRDITEEQKLQQMMEESEKRVESIFKHLPNMSISIVNQNYEFIFLDGGEIREVMGQGINGGEKLLQIRDVVGETVFQETKILLDRAFNGEFVRYESHIPHTDRYYINNYMPFEERDDEVTKVIALSINVTEQKKLSMEKEQLQHQVIETQKQALKDLSTPIIPLFDGILIVPLIGSIDSARARDIMRNMLGSISEYRAKTIIVDITGVPMVDSGVADHLNKTIQAARLKGAHTIVTGISDAVAETIIDLGIDWSEVETLRDLQSGLHFVMTHRQEVL